jgi:hypothetical protein
MEQLTALCHGHVILFGKRNIDAVRVTQPKLTLSTQRRKPGAKTGNNNCEATCLFPSLFYAHPIALVSEAIRSRPESQNSIDIWTAKVVLFGAKMKHPIGTGRKSFMGV